MSKKRDPPGFFLPGQPRRTIRQRLVWGNIIIGVLLLLAGGIAIWQVNRLTQAVGILQVARERATTALEVHQDSTQLIAMISRLLPVEDTTSFETEVAAALDALRESHARLAALTAQAAEDEVAFPLMSRVSNRIDDVIGIAQTMIRQASAGQWPSARVRMGVLLRDHQQLASETDRLVEIANEMEDAAATQVTSAQRAAVIYPALTVGLSMALAVLLTWQTTRSIARPVERLTAGAARLAAGFLDERVAVESSDELGQLAAAFNQMAGRLQVSYAELEQRVAERTAELTAANVRLQREITERKRAEAERERLLAAEREQRLLAETLTEVTLALTSQIGHEAVLDEILRQAQRIVPYSTASIVLLEDETLRIARWQGYEAFGSEEFISGLPLDTEVVRSRKPLVIPDTHQEPRWVVFDETAWIRSYLAVPICLRDRVLGLLRLDSDTPGEFSAEDAQRLQPLVNAAAIALENARLFAATRRQTEQLESLRQVSQDLAALRDLDTLLRHIVERAIQLLGANAGGMYLYRPEREVLEWVVAVGDARERRGVTFERGEGLSGKVWATGKPLIIDDYQSWSGKSPKWSDFPAGATVSVPIQWGDEFLGVLNVWADSTQRRFTPEDASLLSQLATQAAIAIQNTRLFEQVQRHAAELEFRVAERTTELQEQQTRTQAILDAAGEGIVVTNLDGAILYMNPAASRLTGYSLAEASVDTPRLWKSGQHPPEFYEQMWQTILADQVWRGEVVNRRKDGTLFDATLTIAPLPLEEGQAIGFVGILNDITHLKELDRLKSKFVSDVSHELRTPLANVKLYLHLLERSKPEKRAQYMVVLKEQTDRLARLVEDILNLSRLDLGREKVKFAPVDLNAVVEQVVSAHQPRAEAAGLTLLFGPDEALPPLRAERNQLAQVVTNLVDNAISYTPAGQVRVTTNWDKECSQVCLQVEDTGMGIEAEDMPHLFERFYRGRRVGSSSIPGTGLGLAIVKEIVALYRGTIEVESQVGEGSTFRVWLPLE